MEPRAGLGLLVHAALIALPVALSFGFFLLGGTEDLAALRRCS